VFLPLTCSRNTFKNCRVFSSMMYSSLSSEQHTPP
jgi:hypothetical protein